jgi:hypothetical protein
VADDLGVRFFTDAKAQHESAVKWRWLVLALLTYLHVGLVLPFAADTRDKVALDRELADNQKAHRALKPVLDTANTLANRVEVAKNQAAANLKTNLVERFQRLSGVVSALGELNGARAEGAEGAALFGKPAQPQMQQQAAPADPSALPPMSSELRRRIAESAKAVGADQVPPDLQTYIESAVIAPAFKRANEAWAESGLKIAQEEGAAIAKDIVQAKTDAPSAATQLDRLGGSVEALRNEAEHLTFVPPPNPDWWRTVGGKEASIVSMTSNFATRVNDFNANQLAVQALTTQIADVIAQNQQAGAALADKLAELDKRAADLQSQLGEIGGPLKVISFKLSEIAPLLPLIIAVFLAAIATWSAESLRRMTLAAKLVGDEADCAAIRTWLRASVGGSSARVAAVEIAVALASVTWVLLAAENVAFLPAPFLTQPILAATAVAVVAAARLYHWFYANAAASARGLKF